MVISIPLDKAYQTLVSGSVIMISTANQHFKNVMSCAWNCPLDFDPSKFVLVLGRDSTTREIIDETSEFVINIPSQNLINLILDVGSCHGKDVDKFKKFNIDYFEADIVKSPCLKNCLGWLECKVIKEPILEEKYDIVLAEVVNAKVVTEFFDGDKISPINEEFSPLHHISGNEFRTIGKIVVGKS